MSESKTICPHCNRLPGGVHVDGCPRSREVMRSIRDACRAALRPRHFWIFGSQIVRTPDEGEKITFNPGVPYVRPGKPWFFGGKPRDLEKKQEGFIKHMNKARASLLAAKEQKGRQDADED